MSGLANLLLILTFTLTFLTFSMATNGRDYYRVDYSSDSFITETLVNPCLASPTPDQFKDLPVLRVEGRRQLVQGQARHVLKLLGKVDHMPLGTCKGMRLQSLPATGVNVSDALNSDTLSELYQAIFHLGAHFKFMQRDWHDGRSCHRHPHRLIAHLQDVVSSLQHLMCVMMVSPHPSLAAPYPSSGILAMHEQSQTHQLYRFSDCTGRMIRDCVLISSAKQLIAAIARE